MILVMLFVCSILLHGFFAVYVFFSFLFICIFTIGCASMVCVICVFAYCQYSGHSSPFTKKIKIKCSRIQKYGIFTCTKISAITVVSPHTSHQGNYKCSVKSICVQRFLHVDRSDEQWNESTTVKEEIFVGENFRTFPSKTFRMEFNFAL